MHGGSFIQGLTGCFLRLWDKSDLASVSEELTIHTG